MERLGLLNFLRDLFPYWFTFAELDLVISIWLWNLLTSFLGREHVLSFMDCKFIVLVRVADDWEDLDVCSKNWVLVVRSFDVGVLFWYVFMTYPVVLSWNGLERRVFYDCLIRLLLFKSLTSFSGKRSFYFLWRSGYHTMLFCFEFLWRMFLLIDLLKLVRVISKHDSVIRFWSFPLLPFLSLLSFAVNIDEWNLYIVIHQSFYPVHINRFKFRIQKPRFFPIHIFQILSSNHRHRRLVQIWQFIPPVLPMIIYDQNLVLLLRDLESFLIVIFHAHESILKRFEVSVVSHLFERLYFSLLNWWIFD